MTQIRHPRNPTQAFWLSLEVSSGLRIEDEVMFSKFDVEDKNEVIFFWIGVCVRKYSKIFFILFFVYFLYDWKKKIFLGFLYMWEVDFLEMLEYLRRFLLVLCVGIFISLPCFSLFFLYFVKKWEEKKFSGIFVFPLSIFHKEALCLQYLTFIFLFWSFTFFSLQSFTFFLLFFARFSPFLLLFHPQINHFPHCRFFNLLKLIQIT